MNTGLKLTTKGSGDGYKKRAYISSGLYAGMGMILAMFPLFFGFKEKSVLIVSFLGIICLIWGVVEISVKRTQSKTYVEFYENYIQGVGIHGQTIDRFHFENSAVSNITVGNKTRFVMVISIMTNGGKFEVITNREKADEVFNYVSKYMNKTQI